jgi:hypothetical protein
MTPRILSFGDLMAIIGDSIIIVGLALFGTFAVLNPHRLQEYSRSIREVQSD